MEFDGILQILMLDISWRASYVCNIQESKPTVLFEPLKARGVGKAGNMAL